MRTETDDPVLIALRIVIGILAAGMVVAVFWTLSQVPGAALFRPWYLSRAAGLIALILLWASVALGLLQSMGALRKVTKAAANVDVHDYVSVASIYVTLFHAFMLMFDHPQYSYRLSEILVPFASGRSPTLVAFGTLALYLGLVATLTTYMRGRMNQKLWRALHLSTLVGFVMAWVHGLFLGSDSGFPIAWLLYAFTGATTVGLVVWRIIRAYGRTRANPVR